MLNQVIIVGVVESVSNVKETTNGIHYANLILKVRREYRNAEGHYEEDVISVLLWRSVADHCCEICKTGNVVAVKGRLQSSLYNREDGSIFYNYEIIADKVFVLEN